MPKEAVDLYSINDKRAVFASIKERQGEKMSLENIAYDSGVRVTQVRYIIELLVRWGYIEKVCILDMGPRYRRYTYRVIKPYDDYTEYDADEEYSLYAIPVVATRRGEKQ